MKIFTNYGKMFSLKCHSTHKGNNHCEICLLFMYKMLSFRYVLLKERNMLNTLRHEAKRQGVPMPSPQRCYKVTVNNYHEK